MILNLVRLPIIAILALIFNGEFMAHGLGALQIPPLFLMYLCYVTVVDQIISRFHLTDRQLFLLGAAYGLVMEAFFNRTLYVPFNILGINPIVVIIMIMAWGLFAFVLPFWIGNKIISRRTTGWFGSIIRTIVSFIALLGLFNLIGIWSNNLPPLNESGSATALLIILTLITLFFRSRYKHVEYTQIERTKWVYIFITLYLFLGIVARNIGGQAIQLGYAILILTFGALIYFKAWRKHRFLI